MAKKTQKTINHRDAQVTIILGRNGTGKSTIAQNIIQGVGGRSVVVTMNGLPEIWRPYPVIDPANADAWNFKSGIRQVYFMQHGKATFKLIEEHFRNGNLILDDCRKYIKANIDHTPGLHELLIDFRHKMLDVYFVAHAPGQVPPQAWAFYSNAWIGSTDSLLKIKDIDSYEQIIAAQKRVNEKFRIAREKNNGSHYGIFELIQP